MSKPKWHKGAPPSIGWWPASYRKNERSIRWWNGFFWSDFASPENTAEAAAEYAKEPACGIREIKWSIGEIKWSKRWWL